MQIGGFASTVAPEIPEITLALEQEVVEAHQEDHTVANGGSHARRKGPRWRLGGERSPERMLKEGVPEIIIRNVAGDGSGFRHPSLQTTTERQTVINKTERLGGRTSPGEIKPVTQEVDTGGSDQ